MGNVLDKTKQEQVIAQGWLGWSLRRIEQVTGVRRETAGGYLRSAGVALRAPGGWGRKPPKPANEVTTGFLAPATPPEPDRKHTASASEVYRETILLELTRGRNAMASGRIRLTGTASRVAIRASSVSCACCVVPHRQKRGRSSRRGLVKSAKWITALDRWCVIRAPASTGAHGFSY
jgi:hypothetical protein